MIFRVSVLVAASIGVFVFSRQAKGKSSGKENASSERSAKGCSSASFQYGEGDELRDDIPDEGTQEEGIKGVKRISVEENLNPLLTKKETDDKECQEFKNMELEHLQNLIRELKKRKSTLERKLIELYGVKEKRLEIAHLRGHLQKKNADIYKLNSTIHALKAERKDLQEKSRQSNLIKKQLETAKKTVKEMQVKIMEVNNSQMKRQILMLENQLSAYKRNETSNRDAMVEKTLEAAQSIEFDVIEMRRRNKELELEKRELAVKLVAANSKITALSTVTESEILADLEKEISVFRNANINLSKEVEKLQKDRFDLVEEQVYQRWLNVCLRFETQELRTSSKKIINNELHFISGHKSHGETKQLMLDLNTDSISSHASSTESDEIDSSNSAPSSSSSQRSISKNSSTIDGLKRWRRNKEDLSVVSSPEKSIRSSPTQRNGQIRRFSTSMVPSKPLKPSIHSTELDSAGTAPSGKKEMQDSNKSTPKASLARVRRVSFNNAVEISPSMDQNRAKLKKELLDDEFTDRCGCHRSTMKTSLHYQSELAEDEHEIPSPEVTLEKPRRPSESGMDDSADAQVFSKKETAQTELHSRTMDILPNENKSDTDFLHLLAAFFIFFLMVLLCFLHLRARIRKQGPLCLLVF